MRTRFELVKRYLFLVGGLIVNALGTVLLAKSTLGSSPIGSIPLVLSEYYGLSYGIITFVFYIILFIVEVILLGKALRKTDFIQLPLSLIFSVFIDICVSLLTDFEPINYANQIMWVLAGCVFRGIGVSMQVTADVAMLSGEAFMSVISKKTKKDFSLIKFICDIIMVSTAAALSFMFFGKLVGVREGTVISVFLIAPLSRMFSNSMAKYNKEFTLDKGAYTIRKKYTDASAPFILTISSQSGSGGHHIAKILSERLDLELYDNNIPELIADEGDFSESYVRKHTDCLYTHGFWEFFVESYSYTKFNAENYEKIFTAQKSTIEKLAEKGNCIIVGYCSEHILRDNPNVFSIYIHANEDAKLKFLSQKYNVNSKKAREIMKRHDKDRANYFKHFTGNEWNDLNRYSLSIDSSLLGIDDTALVISKMVQNFL